MKTAQASSTKEKSFGWIYFILICLAIAAVISVLCILFAREVFMLSAENASKEPITLVISPNDNTMTDRNTTPNTDDNINANINADTARVAELLKENGLIKSKILFRLYCRLRGKSRGFTTGKYVLSYTSGYSGILRTLSGQTKSKRTQVSVTIPEGSTVGDILRIICDENGICSREELTEAIQNGNFDRYDFVKKLSNIIKKQSSKKADRLYRLEGYLYPDTYYFYSDSSGYAVIDRMLENFDRHFDKKYRDACDSRGITADTAITLASMIVKEAKFVSDYPKISSVFYNRLSSKKFNGLLQSDATLTYALGRPMQTEDKEAENLYNTYKYAGFPPSPICNPDINAISYAICPDDTGYYYFVSDSSGKMYYASNYTEHKRNVEKATKNTK